MTDKTVAAAIIKKGQTLYGIGNAELAQRLAISDDTLRKCLADPGRLTLGQLQVIAKIFHLNPIDRAALIQPVTKKEVKDFILL